MRSSWLLGGNIARQGNKSAHGWWTTAVAEVENCSTVSVHLLHILKSKPLCKRRRRLYSDVYWLCPLSSASSHSRLSTSDAINPVKIQWFLHVFMIFNCELGRKWCWHVCVSVFPQPTRFSKTISVVELIIFCVCGDPVHASRMTSRPIYIFPLWILPSHTSTNVMDRSI